MGRGLAQAPAPGSPSVAASAPTFRQLQVSALALALALVMVLAPALVLPEALPPFLPVPPHARSQQQQALEEVGQDHVGAQGPSRGSRAEWGGQSLTPRHGQRPWIDSLIENAERLLCAERRSKRVGSWGQTQHTQPQPGQTGVSRRAGPGPGGAAPLGVQVD